MSTQPYVLCLSWQTYDELNIKPDGLHQTVIANSGAAFRSYGYDPNGNTTSDGQGNAILYNMLNLPRSIAAKNLSYTYSATGEKLRKNSNGSIIEYIDGIQYRPDGTIDFVKTEEGRANRSGTNYVYEYTLTDHLGNNRVTFDQANGKVGEDDYYPFGLNVHRQVNGGNKYLYNNKELQEELTQYDYGARFYDPVIARWTTMDALSEKYYPLSPYNYVTNSPIKITDPDGNDWFRGSDGGIIWNDSRDKNFSQNNMIYSNIGSTLNITTTSYINTPNDLPLPEELSGVGAGDKLTTNISITDNYKKDGSFSNFTIDYSKTVGATFNYPDLQGVSTGRSVGLDQAIPWHLEQRLVFIALKNGNY